MKRSLIASLSLGLIGAFAFVSALSTVPTPALAQTPEPTDVRVGPSNPTPDPTRPVATVRPPADGGAVGGTPVGGVPTFEPPKDLDQLIEAYPDLAPYLDRVRDLPIGDMDLGELYETIVTIFETEGATGVATFLKDSGILDKLGIPLSYLDLLVAYDEGGLAAVDELARRRGYINRFNELVGYLAIDAPENVDAVRTTLEELGVSVYRYSEFTEELEIGIALDVLALYQTPGALLEYLTQIATAEHVVGFRGPTPSVTSGPVLQGAPDSVGGSTIGADAWLEAGFTGEGVRVGIIDLGFGGILDRIDEGELPDNINTFQDIEELNDQGEDHGTAVAMVIHRVAPDAELFVAWEDPSSKQSWVDALEYMAENDVDIINYSVGGIVGPRDGTSPESLFLDEFIRETGILWVNSAGNYSISHSMFQYNEGSQGYHVFEAEDGSEVPVIPFIAGAPQTNVSLTWDGNWEGREEDEYIFVVLDEDGNEVVAGAEPRRGKRNDFPYQFASFEAEPGELYYLAIGRENGDRDALLDIFIPNALIADWAMVPTYSVVIPADTDSVLTVGATGLTEDELEYYSSQGPTTDDRLKPDITAPTGEMVPGYEELGGFAGTSGAAPLAAGAAALVLQANPDFDNYQLKAFLMESVVDLGESGEDVQFGTGRLALPDPEGGSGGGDNGNTAGGELFAEITDVDVDYNVKVRRDRGMQITASFDLENFEGTEVALVVLFYDANGNELDVEDEDYLLAGTLGTGVLLEIDEESGSYSDITMFIPNDVIADTGESDMLFYVALLDFSDEDNIELLTETEPIEITVE
jgi:subtilisin family serine protease